MNSVEILIKQTKDAYHWVNKLTASVPAELWEEIPDVIASSISWQVGHLVISTYYHSMMVVAGHQPEILNAVPLKQYTKLFGYNTLPQETIGTIPPAELQNTLSYMQSASLSIIRKLSPKELEDALEPTPVEHPVAKNKFEALDWNIKHAMWHCGQVAILKRVVDKSFDFGVKIPGSQAANPPK